MLRRATVGAGSWLGPAGRTKPPAVLACWQNLVTLRTHSTKGSPP